MSAVAIAEMERAAQRLEAALTAETTALEKGDLRRAAELSSGKTTALDAFIAAREGLGSTPLAKAAPRLALPMDRVRKAADRNRKALERGIALQGRVVETIARAAGQPAIATPGYARQAATRADAAPMALTIKA